MSSLARWRLAEQHWAAHQREAAASEYRQLLADPDWILPASLRLGAIAMGSGDVRGAVEHALQAHAAREPDPVLLEALCRLLLDVGELRAALDCVDDPAVAECTEPAVLFGLGRMMSAQGLPDRSLPLLRRAQRHGAVGPELHYRLGNDEAYAGHADAARREYESCLRLAPDFAPAHRGLAKLARATPERNHVARLRSLAQRIADAHPDAPLVHYALFKELDDLGQPDAAWPALAHGMRLRRAQVRHDDADEAALFVALHRVTAAQASPVSAAHDAEAGPQPVFIVGLPRSGTTLLERILGAHPDVADAGELRDAVAQLRWCTNLAGGPHPDAALVDAARGTDLHAFGRRYLAHTQWHAGGRRLYTDKLPANYLLVGLLANALPQARFLHLSRSAMDVCFSNLKELFADAYPHTYDQREMAAHYHRYHALMAHWRAQFPGRILDVDYDALVTDPEATARRVLGFLGLDWDAAVLAPQARSGIVATASSAQVREPIHGRFVGQWHRYASHLQPLREALGEFAG